MDDVYSTKQCGKCKRELPRGAFHKAACNKSGLQSSCKECLFRYSIRPERLAKKRAYDKVYSAARDPNAERVRKRVVTARARKTLDGRARHSAREAVRYAVRSGKLKRLPCEVCGTLKTEAHHHEGYERHNRLNVRWLCTKHHREEHIQENANLGVDATFFS